MSLERKIIWSCLNLKAKIFRIFLNQIIVYNLDCLVTIYPPKTINYFKPFFHTCKPSTLTFVNTICGWIVGISAYVVANNMYFKHITRLTKISTCKLPRQTQKVFLIFNYYLKKLLCKLSIRLYTPPKLRLIWQLRLLNKLTGSKCPCIMYGWVINSNFKIIRTIVLRRVLDNYEQMNTIFSVLFNFLYSYMRLLKNEALKGLRKWKKV